MDDAGRHTLIQSFSILTERELQIITALFRDGRSYRGVASDIGKSARTVQHIKASAVAKLAEALEAEAEALLNPPMPEPQHDNVRARVGPLLVQWERCRICECVGGTIEGLCDRCLPVAEATAMATRR